MTGNTCSPIMPIGWYPMLNTLSGAETWTLPTTKFGDPMLAIPVPAPSPHPTHHTHPPSTQSCCSAGLAQQIAARIRSPREDSHLRPLHAQEPRASSPLYPLIP